jgi:hypothetical protein
MTFEELQALWTGSPDELLLLMVLYGREVDGELIVDLPDDTYNTGDLNVPRAYHRR